MKFVLIILLLYKFLFKSIHKNLFKNKEKMYLQIRFSCERNVLYDGIVYKFFMIIKKHLIHAHYNDFCVSYHSLDLKLSMIHQPFHYYNLEIYINIVAIYQDCKNLC